MGGEGRGGEMGRERKEDGEGREGRDGGKNKALRSLLMYKCSVALILCILNYVMYT